MALCDWLIPQEEVTINLLFQSNANPTVIVYTHISGPFYYNKMPLAPLGCQVQVHKNTEQRGTWVFHLLDGCYISALPEHYRVHNFDIKEIRRKSFSDTIQFQHKSITNTTITYERKHYVRHRRMQKVNTRFGRRQSEAGNQRPAATSRLNKKFHRLRPQLHGTGSIFWIAIVSSDYATSSKGATTSKGAQSTP